FRQTTAELSLTTLALPGVSPVTATPNQVTGYDPESLQIIEMDTAQTETPLPTEEEYVKDMLRIWRRRKNTAVASRDARAPAAKQQAASRPQQAQGKNVPSVASQRAKQLQWRPKNTPRIKEDDIIVVLKPRERLDLKATFGPEQAGAAVRSILGADASVQQIGELRRQNQIFARKIQELEAKQVGPFEPVQEAEAEDGDDGSSVTSRLTNVSRQDADMVVGPASITGSIGRMESLERKTEQLEASVVTLPNQIMSAVRESFQDMLTAALTQALPEIVAQVSNSVLKAVQPWVIAQIKNTTQSDSPQVKRKLASRQAAEEGFSGPAPGPDRSSAP
ncbi:hypothetical protein MRX96_052742, partial [Rhipicephalus microplus]